MASNPQNLFTLFPQVGNAPIGAASMVYTLSLQDAGGNPTPADTGGQAFTLSDGVAGGTFAPSMVTVPAGQVSATFTYSNPAAGSFTLSATPSGGDLAGQSGLTAQCVVSAYTQWPILPDVQAVLVRAGISLRFIHVQPLLDGVVREVEKRTLRQFVMDSSDTSRIYDGTGTAEQETDEILSLTGVTVIGYQSAPGYTLANVYIVNELHKPQTRLVCARGSLPALVGEGYIAPYPTQFPGGRQNIEVTGRFGYGAAIPEDLWESVAEEMAFRLAKEAIFAPGGRVMEDYRGDVKKRYTLTEPEVIGWHDRFEKRMTDPRFGYKRPAGRRLRNLRARMIG